MTTDNSTAPQGLTDAERAGLLSWVSACQSAYHIESTPGHRFGGLAGALEENREGLCEYVDELLSARAALAAAPHAATPSPAEPDFTDTARAALLWVLWHHQGGSSKVGQPLRFALGMGAHDELTKQQVEEARRWGELHSSHTATPVVQPVVPPSANWRASQYGERWVVECRMPCINGLCAWVTVANLGQPEPEDEMFGGLDREGIAKRIAAALSAAPASDADSMQGSQPTKEPT